MTQKTFDLDRYASDRGVATLEVEGEVFAIVGYCGSDGTVRVEFQQGPSEAIETIATMRLRGDQWEKETAS